MIIKRNFFSTLCVLNLDFPKLTFDTNWTLGNTTGNFFFFDDQKKFQQK